MGPSGQGAPSPPCVGGVPTSRGSAGLARPPRFLLGVPAGWESASLAGMGSCSSWAAGVCARLRSDLKAGGVTRAASTRARTYADSPQARVRLRRGRRRPLRWPRRIAPFSGHRFLWTSRAGRPARRSSAAGRRPLLAPATGRSRRARVRPRRGPPCRVSTALP
eukprot:1396748-Pleurochrysis_carterae.AAC.1